MIAMAATRVPRPASSTPPHARSATAVLLDVGSRERGLRPEEARERLIEFGPNELPPPNPTSIVAIVLAQFRSPLIYVLLMAAAVSALAGAHSAMFSMLPRWRSCVGPSYSFLA